MNQRQFGLEGPQVSEVGLGTWQLGGDWGSVSSDDAQSILRAALERGVTFYDTADVYGGGRSEKFIGEFLRDTKADVFVATKLGRSGNPGWPQNFQPNAIRAHTEASLQRLGVESLDLTQLHCIPTEELRKGEVFETLRLLQSEGKIKRFGASVESMEEAHICLAQEGLASLQIIFNIFRQKPVTDVFESAKAKGVAIIVRLPLASGLLSGKFNKDTQFSEGDHRNYNRNGAAFNVGETFAGLPFEKGVELADELKPLVPEGLTLAQMSQRWLLDYDAVTTIIPGAKNVRQVQSNVSVSEFPPLSEELHSKLYHFYRTKVSEYIRGPY